MLQVTGPDLCIGMAEPFLSTCRNQIAKESHYTPSCNHADSRYSRPDVVPTSGVLRLV